MKRFRIFAFCLISALAIATPAIDGQTNAPIDQNNSRVAASGHSHGTNVHATAPVVRNVARGPAGFGSRTVNSQPARMVGQPAMNLRPHYSPSIRPLNPNLVAMNARQNARTYNAQPSAGMLASREIAQSTLPMTNSQRVFRTHDSPPITGEVARREISQGLETIDTQRVARNNNLQPITHDLANREIRQHAARWNEQTRRNRFSYSDALRRNRREWHNCDWWRQHFPTIVLVGGGYYYLNAGYWYPAWGYDPLNNYYDYDGPIYTYGNLLPDQVIANVQVALQDTGYYFGEITGSLNVETRAALANFQRDQGLLITGAIDQPTIESLGLY